MHATPGVAATILLAALLPLHAQEARRAGATNSYVVEYSFRESGDAATAAERRYGIRVNGEHKSSFKVGKRTPVVSASFEPTNANSLVNTQYTYLDVGVSIECSLVELDTRVELHTAVVLGGLAEKDAAPAAGGARNANTNPTISETKFEVTATQQIGKPTVLASITDPVTKRILQVTATVTTAN
jgi:hypothetical protein